MFIGTFKLGILVASIDHPSNRTDMAPVLPEPGFYRDLILTAKRLGIDTYVFSADGFQESCAEISGYRFDQNSWKRMLVPLPDIIYDRCFYTKANELINCRKMLETLASRRPYLLLNGNLPSKLEVYNALKDDSKLASYLPETIRFHSTEQLMQLADRHHHGVILKPSVGMQGRGVVHIRRCPLDHRTYVRGRTRQNNSFSISFSFSEDSEFAQWANRFINQSTCIIQPFLELKDQNDKPFDVRVLLQKDDKGQWSRSGIVIRSGQAGEITSNLHGGGDARPAFEQLVPLFGKEKTERLLAQIHTISKKIAVTLESKFGRFAEFGLDYGIEPDATLWLIEANSKPGRTSFRLISDHEAVRQSIERPLLYARLLARRISPPLITNASAKGSIPYSNTHK